MMRPALLAAALTAALTAAAQPAARWLSTDHDFGAFSEEMGTVTCTVRAVNDGTEPLIIVSARANCGCTKPSYSRAPVAPGDTLTVNVGYDASGRPGRFNKTVTITTNDPDAPRHTFNIHGTVIGAPRTLSKRYPVDLGSIRLREASLRFADVTPSGACGAYIEGVNATPDSLDITLASTPPYLSALVSPSRPGPGDTFVISATVAGAQIPVWDQSTDTIALDLGAHGRALLPVHVTLYDDFATLSDEARGRAPAVAVTPASLDAAPGHPLEWTLRIENIGRSPLTIRRLYSPDPAVSVGRIPATIKPGKAAKVAVSVDSALLEDPAVLNSRLILVTDDPVQPRKILRIIGELVQKFQKNE